MTGATRGTGPAPEGGGLAALERRFPDLRGALPWLPLGRFPTRVVAAPRLGADLGVELWVKRDDESAPGYGGNKVRKLELCLAAARNAGARGVVTVGGLGSNQVVATAFYARRLGLECAALLLPQPVTPLVRANLRAALALGARLHAAPRWRDAPAAVARLVARLGPGFHVLGPGSSSPLGTVGYVAAALELAEQVARGECPEPEAIYVPLGSAGTAAGLLLGLAATGLRTRLCAVRVVSAALGGPGRTLRLARRAARLLRGRGAALAGVSATRLEVVGEFLGPGYGAPTAAAAAAVAQAREREGLVLETTYTGKALAALAARAARHSGPVLFWHTFSSADLGPVVAAGPAGPLPPALAPLVTPW